MSPVMDLLWFHRRRDSTPCSAHPTSRLGRNAWDYEGQEENPSLEKLGIRDGQPHSFQRSP